MDNTVEVTIPVDVEAARALKNPARREAAGRYLSALLKDRAREVLAEATIEAKREARDAGLIDAAIDAELEAWQTERKT